MHFKLWEKTTQVSYMNVQEMSIKELKPKSNQTWELQLGFQHIASHASLLITQKIVKNSIYKSLAQSIKTEINMNMFK